MRMIKIFFCLLAISSQVSAQEVTDSFDKGSINWSAGTITAKGSGVPPQGIVNPVQARLLAERAAVSDARRNLLKIVGAMRVDAISTVGNMMTKSDVVSTRIGGIIKGSVITDKRYREDGSVEVTVVMPITGAFIDVIISENKPVLPAPAAKPLTKGVVRQNDVPVLTPSPPVKEVKITEPKTAPAISRGQQTGGAVELRKVNYSGLIVDARNIGIKPALMPKVIDETGSVIYSAASMQKEEAVRTGVVGYAKEVDAARKHPRVTDTPVVVGSLRASGENGTDAVISRADAEIITATEPSLGYLKMGRVMIVYK